MREVDDQPDNPRNNGRQRHQSDDDPEEGTETSNRGSPFVFLIGAVLSASTATEQGEETEDDESEREHVSE